MEIDEEFKFMKQVYDLLNTVDLDLKCRTIEWVAKKLESDYRKCVEHKTESEETK